VITLSYDKTYKLGNTTINIVSPERTLGRKMTQKEIDSILKECAKVNLEIYNLRVKGEIS